MAYPSFPSRVYLDTSYLVRLLSYPRNPKSPPIRRCKLLYDHLLRGGVDLLTSSFAYEEVVYVLLVKQWLLPEANKRGYGSLKEFRSKDQTQYISVYRQHNGIPRMVQKEFANLQIAMAFPSYFNPALNPSDRVIQYAAAVMRHYWQVDCKDAIHIALARCLNIDMVVACDNDFAAVKQIRHFNPLK